MGPKCFLEPNFFSSYRLVQLKKLGPKWLYWRAGFFPANQGFLKAFQIALIGWIKAGPPKNQAKDVCCGVWTAKPESQNPIPWWTTPITGGPVNIIE